MNNKNTPILSIKDIVAIKSYSHKPHLANLPYDLNTNDADKLKERMEACNEGLKQAQQDLKELKEFKANVEKMEQLNDEVIEESKKRLGWISNTWADVQKEADRFDDPYDEDGDIFEWYDAMEKFMEEMTENPGFITQETKDKYEALYGIEEYDPERYADEESGYPSPMYGAWGFEAYLEDRAKLEDEAGTYLHAFNIDGNGDYATQMKEIMNELPDDWEDKSRTINREIGKAETKVNDYKEHNKKIRDKLNRVSENSQLVELSDGRVVDLNDETGYGDLTVGDVLFDPYDFEPMDYD